MNRPARLEQAVRLSVSSLPLFGSSPIDSSAARPLDAEHQAGVVSPITANCTRCCGRHSTLAPASTSTAEPISVGIAAASAGRSTPGIMPKAVRADTTVAPV